MTRLAGGGSAGGVSSGSVDGLGSTAMFQGPVTLACSASGAVYVADLDNHLIRMISPTGSVPLPLSLAIVIASATIFRCLSLAIVSFVLTSPSTV